MNGYNWNADMKHVIISDMTARRFILECDTSLQYYTTKPMYQYFEDMDSLVLVQDGFRISFNFFVVGCFEYKGFMVVVHTYPLADPNVYNCFVISTYSKDTELIDHIPFFVWRTDLDVLEWGDNLDESWIELTGYIDKDFEITVRQRTPWGDIHDEHGFCKEGLDEGTYEHLHEYVEYHVYNISDDGHFVEVQKPHKYEADDDNNWRRVGDNKQDNSKYTNH